MKDQKIHIAVAGSTQYSTWVAEALNQHTQFSLDWILTPKPKKIGRHQEITPNPLHQWAKKAAVKTYLLSKKVQEFKTEITDYHTKNPVDYLLVVDFGYLVPNWLLQLPNKAVLNLHPSALPKWRGSSPGQFVILFGDEHSAISLMKLTPELDTGPLIAQAEFSVKHHWTSQDYYNHSFKLANQFLTDWISDYHQGKLAEKFQPKKSPTPLARKIKKPDAFIKWDILKNLMQIEPSDSNSQKILKKLKTQLDKTSLMEQILAQNQIKNWPNIIVQASKAFQPWPILWTKIPTPKGKKRMQILSCATGSSGSLQLEEVKIEGQNKAKWNQVKIG